MDKFKKARNTFIAIRAITVSLLILFLSAFLLWEAYEMYNKAGISWRQADKVEGEYNELKERNEMLNKKLEDLDTSIGKEKWLRQAYNVGKEGERVIVIVEPERDEDNQGERTNWLGNIFNIVSSWF